MDSIISVSVQQRVNIVAGILLMGVYLLYRLLIKCRANHRVLMIGAPSGLNRDSRIIAFVLKDSFGRKSGSDAPTSVVDSSTDSLPFPYLHTVSCKAYHLELVVSCRD